MSIRRNARVLRAGLLVAGALALGATTVRAQRGGMYCPMMGQGMRGGMGMMGGGMRDMGAIHSLFSRSDTISRTVKLLPNGIEAVTESSDPKVAALLVEHVAAMKGRLEARQPIRAGDPLFAAIFENADKIKVVVTPTARGVKVVETSDDPYTVKLLQSHAKAVSDFVREGMAGMHRMHPAPPKP